VTRIPPHPKEVAYHEAGHIAVALLLGIGIDSASILPDKSGFGRVRPFLFRYNPTQRETKKEKRDMILHSLAGPIAHKKYNPEMDPISGNFDIENVYKFFQELGIPESIYEEHFNKNYKRTERIVNKKWDFVVKMAEALFEKKELEMDEIYRIYHKYYGLDKILRK
jgi:ATP-dependent Zn protease